MVKILEGVPADVIETRQSLLLNMADEEIVEHFHKKDFRDTVGHPLHLNIDFLCLVMLAKNDNRPFSSNSDTFPH
jgi:hypothetical protein